MNGKESSHLYTVIVGFNDFTQGIEQYDAPSPEEAIVRFVRDAACLQEFPPDARSELIRGGRDIRLIHVANNLHGVWIWVPAQSDARRIESVLGGQVIQTDRHAPLRTT
jgi:hypothetical protein